MSLESSIPFSTTINELRLILVLHGIRRHQLDIVAKYFWSYLPVKVILSSLQFLLYYLCLYAHIMRRFIKYFSIQYAKLIKKELIRSYFANWFVFISQQKSNIKLYKFTGYLFSHNFSTFLSIWYIILCFSFFLDSADVFSQFLLVLLITSFLCLAACSKWIW